MKTLIYSNVFVALCAATLSLGTFHSINACPDYHLVAHIFGVTLMAYNVQRLVRLRKFSNTTEQTRWYLGHKWMLYLALAIGAAISCYTLLYVSWDLLLQFLPLALLSFFYSIPFAHYQGRPLAIRDIPGIKIFLIALVWTGVTYVLPYGLTAQPWRDSNSLMLLERFLFIFAITLPFDVRDLRYDDESMLTVPQVIGRVGSLNLSLVLLICCASISLWVRSCSVYEVENLSFRILPALLYILTALYIRRARSDQHDFFYNGVLDATMLLLGGILMLT